MERKSQGHKLKSVVELCSEPLCIYFNHTEEMCFGDIFVLAACPALAPTKPVVKPACFEEPGYLPLYYCEKTDMALQDCFDFSYTRFGMNLNF